MTSVHRHRRGAVLFTAASLAGAMLATLPAGAAFAGTVTSGYDTANSTGTLGPAAPGDALTRSQMIARAHDWIANAVPYSQTAGWEDSAVGGPYREDCSGFVSMAWALPNSLVTSTLPSVSTVTDTNISGDTNLDPGNALDYTADHVVLFDSWIDQSAGTFYYDAEHTYGQVTNRTEGNIYSSTLEGYPISYFQALRYNHIAAPTRHSSLGSSADGMYVAYADPSGNVVHDWRTSDGVWHGPYALGGTARADSPIVSSADGSYVSFIDTSGQVVHDWKDANGWYGPYALGGTATRVRDWPPATTART